MNSKKKNSLTRLEEFLKYSTLLDKPFIKGVKVQDWDSDESFVVEIAFERSTSEDEILNILDGIWSEIFDFLQIPVYVKYKLV